MARMLFALVVCLFACSPLSAEEYATLWVWPFEQTKKEIGVEFKERVVDLSNTAARTWTHIKVDVGYDNPKAVLASVTEHYVYLLVAGQKEPLRRPKTALTIPDAIYVQNKEIELAKLLMEPGAADLKEVTAESIVQDAADNAMRGERVWSDKTGDKQVIGSYAGFVPPFSIKIKTTEGQTIKVNVNKLSPEDRIVGLALIKADKAKAKKK